MVTLSLFSIIILIFFVHTIFTHLLNWAFRDAEKQDSAGVAVFINLIELVIMFLILWNVTP